MYVIHVMQQLLLMEGNRMFVGNYPQFRALSSLVHDSLVGDIEFPTLDSVWGLLHYSTGQLLLDYSIMVVDRLWFF